MASRVPAALSEFPAQPVRGAGAREGTEEKDWKSLFCFTVIWIAVIPMRKESRHKVSVSGCTVHWGGAQPHGNSTNYKTTCFILEHDSTCFSNQVKEKKVKTEINFHDINSIYPNSSSILILIAVKTINT